MALFNFRFRLKSEEEKELERKKLALLDEQIKALRLKNNLVTAEVADSLSKEAQNALQQVNAVDIRTQAMIKKLLEKKASPELIQKVIADRNQAVLNTYMSTLGKFDTHKEILAKAGVPEADELENLKKQLAPNFVFYNFTQLPDGNYEVQELDPEGVVLNTYVFKTPEEYKMFLESRPEIKDVEKKTTAAKVFELKEMAEMLGMSPQQFYKELRKKEYAPSAFARTVNDIARLTGRPVKEVAEAIFNKRYNLSADITSMGKDIRILNDEAKKILDLYQQVTGEKLDIVGDPINYIPALDLRKVKDERKRHALQVMIDNLANKYGKRFNNLGISMSLKEMKDLTAVVSQAKQFYPLLQKVSNDPKRYANVAKRLIYNYLGRFVDVEKYGLDRLVDYKDAQLFKTGQFLLNTYMKAISGSQVTGKEEERIYNATYTLYNSNKDLFLGLYTLVNDTLARMEYARTAGGDIYFMSKFRYQYDALKRIKQAMDGAIKRVGGDVVDVPTIEGYYGGEEETPVQQSTIVQPKKQQGINVGGLIIE